MAAKPGKGEQGQMILGIGVDLVKIERVRKLLDNYTEFIAQVFTAGEIDSVGLSWSASSFAARFAAKGL